MTYSLQQEQKAPNLRPVYPSAYDYYIDYYSEEEEHTFRITKDSWANIHRSNNLNQKLTETELKIISLVNTLIERSSLGLAYFSLDYLCAKLGVTDRQLRTVRKNINHIFSSRWRKATRINGVLKKNVYVFAYTLQGRSLLGNSTKHYKSVKVGSRLPTSIYKDENIYIKDRSSESNFLQNPQSEEIEEISNPEPIQFSKVALRNKKRLPNQRKKSTNQELKAKIYSPKFKQYDQPKNLGDHYPLTTEDCSELQSRSGRNFTLNAMNEILLDMSRKPKESRHKFPSKAAFMAYMSKVYQYEGRDAVKTANLGFKILARATKAEVVAYTTQTQRNDFMATFEETAINCPTPENRFKAKIACTLPPMIGYNLLSSIKSVLFSGNRLEIHLANQLNINHHEQAILKEAMAVDAKITALSVCCS